MLAANCLFGGLLENMPTVDGEGEVDLESETNNRMADAEDQVKHTHLAMRAPEATLQAKF